jgi:hypothetical protein
MPLWRIRIRLSDDPHSRALLDQALDGQRVSEVSFAPHVTDSAEMAGDVVLELPRDDDLGTMLSALHRISPQVFVSRVDEDSTASGGSADEGSADEGSAGEEPTVRQPALAGRARSGGPFGGGESGSMAAD